MGYFAGECFTENLCASAGSDDGGVGPPFYSMAPSEESPNRAEVDRFIRESVDSVPHLAGWSKILQNVCGLSASAPGDRQYILWVL
jgi:hypothetical protein